MRRRRLIAGPVGFVVLVLLPALTGCLGSGSASPPTTVAKQPAAVYAAVGASESVGVGADAPLRDAWPQVFFRTALPRDSVFVNYGISGATVAQALTDEVPDAVALKPTVVTVWLNVNDIISFVAPKTYETRLRQLVHELRRNGRTRVLVANTPPLDKLPALPAFVPGAFVNGVVDVYNQAIARVAQEEGAVVVDLHAMGVQAEQDGKFLSLVSGDGFHPSTAGHAAVAKAFADAYRKATG